MNCYKINYFYYEVKTYYKAENYIKKFDLTYGYTVIIYSLTLNYIPTTIKIKLFLRVVTELQYYA